jgi:hypothetical protein
LKRVKEACLDHPGAVTRGRLPAQANDGSLKDGSKPVEIPMTPDHGRQVVH